MSSATLSSLASVAKAFGGAGVSFIAALLAVKNTGGGLDSTAYLAATLAALSSFSTVWLLPNRGATAPLPAPTPPIVDSAASVPPSPDARHAQDTAPAPEQPAEPPPPTA